MHLRNVQSLVHFFPNRHKSKVKARGSACVGIAVRQYANVYVLMQIHESFSIDLSAQTSAYLFSYSRRC